MPVPRVVKRIGWFLALWLAGVLGLAIVAFAIRAVLF